MTLPRPLPQNPKSPGLCNNVYRPLNLIVDSTPYTLWMLISSKPTIYIDRDCIESLLTDQVIRTWGYPHPDSQLCFYSIFTSDPIHLWYVQI